MPSVQGAHGTHGDAVLFTASQAGTRGGEPWAMQLRCPHSQVCDTANEACGL